MSVVDLATNTLAAVPSVAPSSQGISTESHDFTRALALAQSGDGSDRGDSSSDSTATVPQWGSSREARGDARLAMWLASTRATAQPASVPAGPGLFDTTPTVSKDRGDSAAPLADAEAAPALSGGVVEGAATTIAVPLPVPAPLSATNTWPLPEVIKGSFDASDPEQALYPDATVAPAVDGTLGLDPTIQDAAAAASDIVDGGTTWVPRAETDDTPSMRPVDPDLRFDPARHLGQPRTTGQTEGSATGLSAEQAADSRAPRPGLERRIAVQPASESPSLDGRTHAGASSPAVVDQDRVGREQGGQDRGGQDAAAQGHSSQGRSDVSQASAAAMSASARVSGRVSTYIRTNASPAVAATPDDSLRAPTAPSSRRLPTDHVDSTDAMTTKRPRESNGSPIGALPTLVALPVAPLTNPAAAVMAPTAIGTLEGVVGEDLRDQIVQGLKVQWHGTHGDARIRLQPQYLGELTVSLRIEQGAVSAELAASSPEVRQWIEANEALLRQGLAQQDLRLERLVVAKDDLPASPKREQEAEPRDRQEPKRRNRRAPSDATFEVVV